MIPNESFCQMSEEGQWLWASILCDDCPHILEQNALANHPPPAHGGSLGGHGCGTFAQKWEKSCASLHDIAPPEHSPDPTTEGLDTPVPHNGEELDFINSICNQFDVDLETLYAHAAKFHTDINTRTQLNNVTKM